MVGTQLHLILNQATNCGLEAPGGSEDRLAPLTSVCPVRPLSLQVFPVLTGVPVTIELALLSSKALRPVKSVLQSSTSPPAVLGPAPDPAPLDPGPLQVQPHSRSLPSSWELFEFRKQRGKSGKHR